MARHDGFKKAAPHNRPPPPVTSASPARRGKGAAAPRAGGKGHGGKVGQSKPRPLGKDEKARLQQSNLTKEQKERMLKDRRNYSAKNSSYKANLRLNEQRRQQDREKELLQQQRQQSEQEQQEQKDQKNQSKQEKVEQQKQLQRQQQEAGAKREQQRKDAKASKASSKKQQEDIRKQRAQDIKDKKAQARQLRLEEKLKKKGKVHASGEEDLDMPRHWLTVWAYEVLRDMKRTCRILQLYCLPSCCGPRLPEPLTLSASVIRRHNITRFQLRRMLLEFRFVDRDRSGRIDLAEFLALMNEPVSKYSKALFRLVDRDSDGLLTFDEFVCMLGSFCVYDMTKMLEFIFTSFNDDGTTEGLMHQSHFLELQRMIRQDMKDTWTQGDRKVKERTGMTVADRAEQAKLLEQEKQAKEQAFLEKCEQDMRKIGRSSAGEFITLPEFGYWGKKNRLLLYPAYRLQHKLQRRTLGTYKWSRMMATDRSRRALLLHLQKFNGDFPPLSCFESWLLKNFGYCKFRSVLGAEEFDAKWAIRHPTYAAKKKRRRCWGPRSDERTAEDDALPAAQGKKNGLLGFVRKCCTCVNVRNYWKEKKSKAKGVEAEQDLELLPYHHEDAIPGAGGGADGGGARRGSDIVVDEDREFSSSSVTPLPFIPSASFAGAKEGYVYTNGPQGQGYYPEKEGDAAKHKFPDGTSYGSGNGDDEEKQDENPAGTGEIDNTPSGWTPKESKPQQPLPEPVPQVQQVPDARTLSQMPTERRNAFVKDKFGDVWEVCETSSSSAAPSPASPTSIAGGDALPPGMRFYFCHRTGLSRWDQPPGLVLPPVTVFPHPVIRGRRPSQIKGDVEWAI
jgi:Ca2+-binding EF-hand superfamily protein